MKLLDQIIVKTLPFVPKAVVGALSKAYIAGDNLTSAINCVKDLNAKGFKVTIDILGEFVSKLEQADESMEGYRQVLKAIRENQLDANISVKPTSFGLLLDRQYTEQLLGKLLDETAAMGNFMRLDMEDSPCTSMTIDLYNRFRARHPKNVGIVLQAYLRRTVDDIKTITASPAHFRLCKGIYVEPESIAYKGYQEVRDNFMKALGTMFDGGAFVGIATHDDYLVEQAIKMVRERGLGPDRYEFQMLLGVREQLRDHILADGHNVRIYVPYGQDWYGYSVRRLKENPSLAGTFFKAIFFNK